MKGRDREGAILEGLRGEPFESLFQALDMAVDHPTNRVVTALFRCAHDRGGPGGYGAIAALFTIHRKIDSPDDWTYRPLFLRIADMDPKVRRPAFKEACGILGVRPGTASPSSSTRLPSGSPSRRHRK
ncbi:MAG: hypothetical protein EHM91_12805 [Planctomycetota bacterium]|nr:MAG: hypothetical protein EHM91_12805 [Planctomycetota bacterium]